MIGSLPRREREIFEILCSAGEATAAQVRDKMTSPPSYSAVRTLLGRLEAKGLATHHALDQTYIYACAPQGEQVRESALRQLVKTFFDGSASSAATALLGLTRKLETQEVEALQRAVDEARERGQ